MAALLGLLAAAAVAVLMSLGAVLQRRRARMLDRQRDALLSDVGLLQAALLPAVPSRMGGLDVSVAYRPAAGLAAGGDFFDVFPLTDARTGIIVGDVSGHGRESLVQAALARYTLRTLMGEGHALGEVLTKADRYLAAELDDAFVTVVVCVYDRETCELRWAKAGHEAPIIAGELDSLEESATPLGLGMGVAWPEFSRVLHPLQRACFFTDGLVEGRRDGAVAGRERLRSLVDQGLDAQAIVDGVAAGGSDRSDDVAVVVVGRSAPAPLAGQGGDRNATARQQAS